ncbi:PadR family transcriptional regulator [Methylobacterium sp. D53M]
MSAQTLKVLRALLTSSAKELSGVQIADATKLASGTLYPILIRLEGCGWLESKWEDGDPRELGRPRRRFYWLSAVGARKAKSALNELQIEVGGLKWA